MSGPRRPMSSQRHRSPMPQSLVSTSLPGLRAATGAVMPIRPAAPTAPQRPSGSRGPASFLLAFLAIGGPWTGAGAAAQSRAPHTLTAVMLPSSAEARVPERTRRAAAAAVADALHEDGVTVLPNADASVRLAADPNRDCAAIDCAHLIARAIGADYAVVVTVWSRGHERPSAVAVSLVSAEREAWGGEALVEGDVAQAARGALRMARQRQGVARLGTLVIRTEPHEATVEIDGQRAGHTPFRRMVEPGDHRIAVYLDGHHAASRTVTVGRDQETAVDLALEPIPSLEPRRLDPDAPAGPNVRSATGPVDSPSDAGAAIASGEGDRHGRSTGPDPAVTPARGTRNATNWWFAGGLTATGLIGGGMFAYGVLHDGTDQGAIPGGHEIAVIEPWHIAAGIAGATCLVAAAVFASLAIIGEDGAVGSDGGASASATTYGIVADTEGATLSFEQRF